MVSLFFTSMNLFFSGKRLLRLKFFANAATNDRLVQRQNHQTYSMVLYSFIEQLWRNFCSEISLALTLFAFRDSWKMWFFLFFWCPCPSSPLGVQCSVWGVSLPFLSLGSNWHLGHAQLPVGTNHRGLAGLHGSWQQNYVWDIWRL